MAGVLAAVWLGLSVTFALAAGGQEAKEASAPNRTSDIILQGKLYSPLKRQVMQQFKGTVASVGVKAGQQVKKGDILAKIRLSSESILQIRRRLSAPQIGELDSKLAETDKNIAALHSRLKELKQLAERKMASEEAIRQTEREIEFNERQRATFKERANAERQLAKDDLDYLKEQLGKSVNAGNLSSELVLTAPIAGYVSWIHDDMRENAEFSPGTALFTVVVMDPLLVRANAHETEAMQIRLGEKAEVAIESIPGTTMEATVNRISWAPQAPGLDQPTYYEVEFTLPNPAVLLREGLTAQITLRKNK